MNNDINELSLCQNGCGVRFSKHNVKKHQKFCKYFTENIKKPVDNTQAPVSGMRLPNNLFSSSLKQSYHQKKQAVHKANQQKKNWKQDSQSFRKMIKQAKNLQEQTSIVVSSLKSMTQQMHLSNASQPTLKQCKHCTRKFNLKCLAKHQNVCQKVFMKKRSVFDTKAFRSIQN